MFEINNKIRIVKADERNLELQELRTITGKNKAPRTEWCGCGYYSDLRSAICGALDKLLFDSCDDKLSLQNILAKIDNVKSEILNGIKEKNNANND